MHCFHAVIESQKRVNDTGRPGERGCGRIGLEGNMDEKKVKKPKKVQKKAKGKTVGKVLEKDFASAMKEVKEPLKELKGFWKDLKDEIGI